MAKAAEQQAQQQLSADQLSGVLASNAAETEDSVEDLLREALEADIEAEEEAAEEAPAEAAAEGEGGESGAGGEDAEEGGSDAEAAPEGDDEAADEEGEEADPLEPPADWSAEDHELFHAQSPEVQKWMLDKSSALSGDFEQRTKDLQEDRQRLEPLTKVIEPWAEALERDHGNVASGIDYLLKVSAFAAQQPAEFLGWFADNRRIDLSQIAGQTAQPNGQNGAELSGDAELYQDATTRGLLDKIAGLEKQLNDLTGGLQTREELERQRVANEEQRVVDDFKNATDENGSLRHPFFEDVRGHMRALIKEGLATDLTTAYDQAIRANPDVWRKTEASRKAAADREARKAKRKKADAAKKAGSSISGAPTAAQEREPFDDPTDELRAQAEEMGLKL